MPNATAPDAAEILRSIGEVPYCWNLENDALAWGANAAEVLMIADMASAATGRAYAHLLDPDNQATRFDAITQSSERDAGAGVRYQVQYGLRRDGAGPTLWVEDTGRWFADPQGRPVRAHGVVRVINERHAREEQLAFLSRFDALTGELNRFSLTELMDAALAEAIRYRASCGFLIVAIDNLTRIN